MSKRTLAMELLTVAGFCAFLFFFGLGAFGLTGADEPRYAQIAREMLARHDWVTPVLYGRPWLEKPILFYWRAAISYKVFGVSDAAARLPSASLAFGLVILTYFWMKKFKPGAHYPTFAIGIKAIIVVKVQVLNSLLICIGVELDDDSRRCCS